MVTALKTLTINTVKMDEMVRFYLALGVPMIAVQVRQGTEVYRGRIGDLEVQLAEIPQKVRLPTPDLSLRFFTADIDEVFKRLKSLPGIEVLMELQEANQGKMAIILDPDGHSIELVQSSF